MRDSAGAEVTDGSRLSSNPQNDGDVGRLTELQNGTYTVAWRNVSSVDGHKVTGSFLFAVGEPLGAESESASEQQPILLSPFDPLVRWFIYIGIAVFAGGLAFELLIVTRSRPIRRSVRPHRIRPRNIEALSPPSRSVQ